VAPNLSSGAEDGIQACDRIRLVLSGVKWEPFVRSPTRLVHDLLGAIPVDTGVTPPFNNCVGLELEWRNPPPSLLLPSNPLHPKSH
jgi:hypothetical protein